MEADSAYHQRVAARPRHRPPRLPVPPPLWFVVAGEASVVFGAALLGAVLLHWSTAGQPVQIEQVAELLQLAGAATTAVIALLCALAGRLQRDRGIPTITAAWIFYALVVIPLSVVRSMAQTGPLPLVRTGGLAAAVVFLALHAFGLLRSQPRWAGGVRGLFGGIAFTVLVIAGAHWLPRSAAAMLDGSLADRAVLLGWMGLAAVCVLRGMHRREPLWWRWGFGLGVIAAAHLLIPRAGGAAGAVSGPVLLEFPLLRLIGLLVLGVGVGLHTHTLVRERRQQRAHQAETAAISALLGAERDHEIRNALSNLAAVSTLLATPEQHSAPELATVTGMVDSEFARVRALLEGRDQPEHACTPVDAVLERLVTLRRITGHPISLECPRELFAAAPPATLAQVITNLLTNCATHAPGAHVDVTARRIGQTCRIEVTDSGPGMGDGEGARPGSGRGLGLALSTQLLADVGGSLMLRPRDTGSDGTVARVELPLLTDSMRGHGRLATRAAS
ncbi:MAG: ATP-binding protein [Sciscionella sp.]